MVDALRTDIAPAVTGPFAANSLLLLHRAVEWWVAQGFQYVDLPWMVPKEFSDATRPAYCRDIESLHGSFVASGEQSFLQLWEQERLPAGAPGYIGWTPCLRDEVLDTTHQHGFMKAEWFVPLDPARDAMWRSWLLKLVGDQSVMFGTLTRRAGESLPPRAEAFWSGPEQIDLMIGGLEVGSYGRRFFNGRPYLYGTALALPRFTQATQA